MTVLQNCLNLFQLSFLAVTVAIRLPTSIFPPRANTLCGLLPNIARAEVGECAGSTREWSGPESSTELPYGRRSDGEWPQLTLVEEVAKNDRHPHSERISNHILRVGVRAGGVPTVRVTGPCAPTGVRTLRDLGGSGGLTPSIASRPAQDVRTEANLETWERWSSRLLEDDAVRPHRGARAVLPNWEAACLEGPRRSSAHLLGRRK